MDICVGEPDTIRRFQVEVHTGDKKANLIVQSLMSSSAFVVRYQVEIVSIGEV